MQQPPSKRRREVWRPTYSGKTQPLVRRSPDLPPRPGPLRRLRSRNPALFDVLELISRLVPLLVTNFVILMLMATSLARKTRLMREPSVQASVLVFVVVVLGTLCCCALLWDRGWREQLRFFAAEVLALAITLVFCALLG